MPDRALRLIKIKPNYRLIKISQKTPNARQGITTYSDPSTDNNYPVVRKPPMPDRALRRLATSPTEQSTQRQKTPNARQGITTLISQRLIRVAE